MDSSAKITKSMREVDVERNWLIVDVAGKTLGRVATQIATLLRGKNKPFYTPHVDCGDYVVGISLPDERSGFLVMLGDEAVDGGL